MDKEGKQHKAANCVLPSLEIHKKNRDHVQVKHPLPKQT